MVSHPNRRAICFCSESWNREALASTVWCDSCSLASWTALTMDANSLYAVACNGVAINGCGFGSRSKGRPVCCAWWSLCMGHLKVGPMRNCKCASN